MTDEPSFQRGDIWTVDFGQPVGHEQGMERPAVIVSAPGLVNTAHIHGVLIVVPGTKTPQLNAHGAVRQTVVQAEPSRVTGLTHTTYFMAEKVRAASVIRFRRLLGRLERHNLQEVEDRLCLVMDLFSGH